MIVHWSSQTPTARKPHRCMMCGRTIQPGEQYLKGSGMDGNTAWTWKSCGHCNQLIERLLRANEVWEDGSGYGMDSIANWEPSDIPGLRRKANWSRQWTRRDGSLLPLPYDQEDHS